MSSDTQIAFDKLIKVALELLRIAPKGVEISITIGGQRYVLSLKAQPIAPPINS